MHDPPGDRALTVKLRSPRTPSVIIQASALRIVSTMSASAAASRNSLPRLGAVLACALTGWELRRSDYNERFGPFFLGSSISWNRDVSCTTLCQPPHSEPTADSRHPSVSISSFRKFLYGWNLCSLPLPRRLQPHDPDLTLSPRRIRQRQRDEVTVRGLQERILQAIRARDESQLADLLKQSYAVLYGTPTARASQSLGTKTTAANAAFSDYYTPQDRQDFVLQYGCTGWTEEVLLMMCEMARDRGFVEIGAGQGQWARALTERYQTLLDDEEDEKDGEAYPFQKPKPYHKKQFDFVLAYDDYSALPLNPEIYHKRTKAHQQNFFSKVQDCSNSSLSSILQSWPCRGRILLLVYPPGNDMAIDALQAYVQGDPVRNNTIVYVGEGRGGVNANDKFFDALESGDWDLQQMHSVNVFGTKGYERLYVFRRCL